MLFAIKPLFASASLTATTLLVAGGVSYSIGVMFHLWESLPCQPPIWHGFFIAGAVCHHAALLQEIAVPGLFA